MDKNTNICYTLRMSIWCEEEMSDIYEDIAIYNDKNTAEDILADLNECFSNNYDVSFDIVTSFCNLSLNDVHDKVRSIHYNYNAVRGCQ